MNIHIYQLHNILLLELFTLIAQPNDAELHFQFDHMFLP